ncbi:MAG: 6-phospho-3-hexuloisomerase [Candidatus Bathyarchaeia archaeon]
MEPLSTYTGELTRALNGMPQTEGYPTEYYRVVSESIIKAVGDSLQEVDSNQVSSLIDLLIECKKSERKILIVGAGRSGLTGRAFAMRLMHLSFGVHVIGETITPAVEKNDVLLAISGSGETTLVLAAAKIAKNMGAKTVAVTSHPKSPLGQIADRIVIIPGRTKVAEKKDYFQRQILGVHEPLAPLGTLFELASAVFLDSLIVELMRRLNLSEDAMKKRHATIE